MRLALTLLAFFICVSAPPAEASAKERLKTAGQKIKFYARKAIAFPFYVGGGALGGSILWWHLGGHEESVSDLFYIPLAGGS